MIASQKWVAEVVEAVGGGGEDFTFSSGAGPLHVDLSGQRFSGTIDAGYSIQNGSLVFGIEGDLTGFTGGEGADFQNPLVASPPNQPRVDGRLDALLTARARVGMSVDQLLIYGTATCDATM